MTVRTLLPTRHRAVLTAIRNLYTRHGTCPTLAAIATATGLPTAQVVTDLHELRRMGWISTDPDRPRAIHVRNPTDGSNH